MVRRWIDRYNERDFDGLVELTSEDFEMKSLFADIESGGVFRGHAGFPFAYFKTMDDAYARFQVVVHELIDVGAAVVMLADLDWRGTASGAEGRSPLMAAFWLRAGKIFREESFTTRAEALEAVGLRE